jgi:transcriptional regulator GlxA family with amidase domain
VASVCTGALLLAAAGLLAGRPATTNRLALARLRETDAEVIDTRVVDDGDVLTSQGVTAGMDLALWLVERERGADFADALARGVEYERTGRVWRREGANA